MRLLAAWRHVAGSEPKLWTNEMFGFTHTHLIAHMQHDHFAVSPAIWDSVWVERIMTIWFTLVHRVHITSLRWVFFAVFSVGLKYQETERRNRRVRRCSVLHWLDFLCIAQRLLLARCSCTAGGGLSRRVGEGPVSSRAEQLETTAQPHQSISHWARQPPCKSTSYPSISASTESGSKLSMKLHYDVLISNYVSLWCCLHVSIFFFQHIKLHFIHPPAQVLSKLSNQAARKILMCE